MGPVNLLLHFLSKLLLPFRGDGREVENIPCDSILSLMLAVKIKNSALYVRYMPLLQQYVPQVTFHKTRLGNESIYTCYYTFHVFKDDRIVITQHGYPLAV